MLGSALLRQLSLRPELEVRGTVRSVGELPPLFTAEVGELLVEVVDIAEDASRLAAIDVADVVINAVGLIKQNVGLQDLIATVKINALLPQQLAVECAERGKRLIHVSTDCVFSGRRGGYSENDEPDPIDFYGRSKLLGEVPEPGLTLRTSIIGHEVRRHASLVDWFLTHPQTAVQGFDRAIFSGVTTHEFARLLAEVVLPRPDLTGLYHVSSEPISKYRLLQVVAGQYGWEGRICRSIEFHCDRSMQSRLLEAATGYRPPPWPEMVRQMHAFRPAWAVLPCAKKVST